MHLRLNPLFNFLVSTIVIFKVDNALIYMISMSKKHILYFSYVTANVHFTQLESEFMHDPKSAAIELTMIQN